MNIVNVGYDSTNYYVLDFRGGKLLVDCGWPGTLPKFIARLKRKGIGLNEIRYLLVTHFHPDHAGIVQEIKGLGAELILMESQAHFIAPMHEMFRKKKLPFLEIQEEGNLRLKSADSRHFLAGLGLEGEIISTPGHSDDSVTLILDNGYAFTGDLHQPSMLPEDDLVSRRSWEAINRHQITRIFSGHGG